MRQFPTRMLAAAPHRIMFFSGMVSLCLASAWWSLHLLARYIGHPLFALDLRIAPVWAHAFLMLFTVLPAFIFGFLFTTFPRWMNGPEVRRPVYLLTGIALMLASALWFAGVHGPAAFRWLSMVLALAALMNGLRALLRVWIDAEKTVPHAVTASIGLSVGTVALAGFAWGVLRGNDFAAHFAVRVALWGMLLPVFFSVSHRMIPFFSQSALKDYVPWRPLWLLIAVVGLAYARLLLGTIGALQALVFVDASLCGLTAYCAWRWSSRAAGGNPLLWTLYLGFAWLPLAMLLQTARDLSFVVSGEWTLGLAPIHALGMGYFTSMLIAMVTRVTVGHSGRALAMNRTILACFLGLQGATLMRIASETILAPAAVAGLLLAAVALWLVTVGGWAIQLVGMYLSPRVDGRPG